MSQRLKIVFEGTPLPTNNPYRGNGDTGRTEAQAKYERMWLLDPEQFNPEHSLLERERIERTKAFISELPRPHTCIDLGAGYGDLARFLASRGTEVTAVDISKNGLKRLEGTPGITIVQDYVPYTTIEHTKYDLVLSTDLIAHLHSSDYRLYVSELVKFSKQEGLIVCSTPIDVHTDEALSLFMGLMETEIIIEKSLFSYHRLSIRIVEFFKKIKLSILARFLENSKVFVAACEKISKAIWQDSGVSHVIFCGRKKPIMPLPPQGERPVEAKGKRSTWD